MPFSPHRDSFDPDTLVVFCAALDDAWKRLQASVSDGVDENTRHRLAELIVHRAKSGGYDHDTLVDYALSNLRALAERA